MNESRRQYYAILQVLRTLIRDKYACQTTKTSKWCWCDEKWNIQRGRMKCVYEMTYTLKMNRETINNLCIGQVTKTQKWIYCVCKSEIISISKSIFVKGTWNLAYLTEYCHTKIKISTLFIFKLDWIWWRFFEKKPLHD